MIKPEDRVWRLSNLVKGTVNDIEQFEQARYYFVIWDDGDRSWEIRADIVPVVES